MNPLLTDSVQAAAPLQAQRFVGYAGTLPEAGGAVLGVVRSQAAAGELVPVDVLGLVAVEAGAPIAVGDAIEADGLGRALPRAAGLRIGRARSAASAAGQAVAVSLHPH